MGLNVGNKFLSNCPNNYSNTKHNLSIVATIAVAGLTFITMAASAVVGFIGLFFGGKKRK